MTDENTTDDTQSEEDLKAEPREPGEAQAAKIREGQPQSARRSPVGTIVIAIVALAIIAIGVWAWMGMAEPEPGELLQRAADTYANAEQVHVESSTELDIAIGGQTQNMSTPTSVWFSRPNRLHLQTGGEMQQVTAISDGESLYVQFEGLAGAVKIPAAQSFEEMPLEMLMMSPGGVDALPLPDVRSLVSGAFDVASFESVTEGIDEQSEWLASLEAPEGTRALTLQPTNGPTVAAWIDGKTNAVRKFATIVDYEALVAADEQFAAMIEQMPEEMLEMYRQMEMHITADFETVEFGASAPEGTFAFAPEEGTEIVEATSIEEGIMSLRASGQADMPDMPEETDLTGQEPPGFTAEDLDGNAVELSSFKGKPLVLDFWATWCPPCREAFPIMDELYAEYRDQGLQVVAVSNDQSVDEVHSFLEENEVDFTILWLPPEMEQQVSADYGITGIPRTLYIDSDWTVQVDDTGLHEKSQMLESLQKIGIETGE